jgi:hypothetical protein
MQGLVEKYRTTNCQGTGKKIKRDKNRQQPKECIYGRYIRTITGNIQYERELAWVLERGGPRNGAVLLVKVPKQCM